MCRNYINKYTQCNAPVFYRAGTISGMEGLLAEMYTSKKSNCRSAASTCTQWYKVKGQLVCRFCVKNALFI